MEKVSIIIPTLNREEILLQTLKEFDRQRYEDFEILVIDQSDQPISGYKNVQFYHLQEKSLPNARNYGAKVAKGTILLFVDDDVLIENENFIKNHVKHYGFPEVGAVVGRVIQPWDEKIYERMSRITPFLLRVSGSFNSKKAQNAKNIIGCNFSCRKNVYFKVKGFDLNFKGTASMEDVDFALRLRKSGFKIFFEPEAAVKHLALRKGGVRNSCQKQIEQFYWFFSNYVYLFLKHGRKILLPLFLFYLLARGFFYIFKYRNIRIFSYSTIRGIYHGLKRKNI